MVFQQGGWIQGGHRDFEWNFVVGGVVLCRAVLRLLRRGGVTLRGKSGVAVGLVLTAVGLRLISSQTADLSYLVLGVFALTGRANAVRALALCWIFAMLSPGIAAEDPGVVLGRYVVFAGAAISIAARGALIDRKFRVKKGVLATLLLGLFLVLHSLLFSPVVSVSLLKATSWAIVMASLIAGWGSLDCVARDRLARQIYLGLVAVMLLSLPLLAFPQGYLRNGTGFQGIMDHPQAFGPTMGILGAWSVGLALSEAKPRWTMVLVALVSMVLVILSEARTAGVALILGLILAVVSSPMLSGRRILDVLPGLRSPRVHLVMGLAVLAALAAGASLSALLANYLAKSGRADGGTLIAVYEQSRGGSMQAMWSNIKSQPLQGIGFGIATNPEFMEVRRDPILGFPIGASVEKGVLPLAVWEELGGFGLVIVLAWLTLVLVKGASAGVVPLAVGWTAILLNMGESTLFSPGAMGLLPLILLGWMLACGRQLSRRREIQHESPALGSGAG